MLNLRRNIQRRHTRRGEGEIWQVFFPPDDETLGLEGFGSLICLDEIRLAPGERTEYHGGAETEIVTYVYGGAISQEDSTGNSSVIRAGEFQHTSTGLRIRRKETNLVQAGWANVFHSNVIRAGEFQHTSTGLRIRRT